MESKRQAAAGKKPSESNPEDVLAAAADVAKNPRAEDPGELRQQILELEDQLDEKEQLVVALTDRLEQAAEQLDRLHRKGADRGLQVAGIPQELLNEQKTLVGDLQRAVEQWDEMQPAALLGRIEVQLTELRDLVASELPKLGTVARPSAPERAPRQEQPAARPAEKAPSGSPTAGWEAVKASLLSGEGAPQAVPAREPGGELDLSEHEAPRPIDVAQAGRDQLAAAVSERDEYIAWLIRKLRTATSWTPPPWESLEGVPQEVLEQVRTLEKSLEEKLRLAEVEMSVERAKLGRDYNRLQQQQQQFEKQLKQLGPKDDHEPGAAEKTDRRWLKYLGVKSDS